MLKNNNRAAVRNLGIRSLRQNRTRNLFAIIAIILTTFMFTTVFGFGFSLVKNINVLQLRMQGTKTTIILRKPDDSQVRLAGEAENLYAAGIQVLAGTASDSEGQINILLDYYDETEFEKNLKPAISDVNGFYPSRENEIMLPAAALAALQIRQPERGMEILLTTGSVRKKFVLSGWFTDYTSAFGSFQGLVSKEYADAQHKTVEGDGILCMSAKAGKQAELLEELNRLLTLHPGQKFETVYDVQQENQQNALTVVFAIAVISLIIVLSGYLLISNIMHISVIKDIRFYGMLKTIGTSPSQIRTLVKMQAEHLSLVGIPIGTILGVVLSFLIIPTAHRFFQMGQDGAMPSDISFHPVIYLGTVLFTIITVNISCHKPAKLAGRISAVEATKYYGSRNMKIRAKGTTDGGKLYKMAFRNVFREKKRTFLVFASLFMGTMAFLSVDTFVGSMKLENYINYYLPNDFVIFIDSGDEEDTEKDRTADIQYDNRLLGELEGLEGVTTVWANRCANAVLAFDETIYRPFLERDFADDRSRQEAADFYREHADDRESAYQTQAVAVDAQMIKTYMEKTGREMDIRQFEAGEICLMGFAGTDEQAENMVGQVVTMKNPDTEETLSLEVGCCATMEEHDLFQIEHHWPQNGTPNCILVSQAAMRKFCGKLPIQNIIVDCEPEAESGVKEEIKRLVSVNPSVSYMIIKSQYVEEFKTSSKAMYLLGGGISGILIFIGIINFINVMMTGVYVRRRELAVLESIGMTKRQLKRMLVYEGVYYGAITLALVYSLGNVLVYIIAGLARQIANYAVFHYPAGFMCIISVVVMAVCMFIPAIVYQVVSKESVTDRRRAVE